MEIKVFGPGCNRCTQTEALVREVAATIDASISVEKAFDAREMMALGIMSTPAIVIDGVVKSTGKIPTKEEIATWINGAVSPAACCGKGCNCR